MARAGFSADIPVFLTQFCVRIEKNPGLGFSISGGISGQGNPFKPSDKVSWKFLSPCSLFESSQSGGREHEGDVCALLLG